MGGVRWREKEVGNNAIVFNLKNKRRDGPAFFEFFCFGVFLFLVILFCVSGRVSCLTL